MPFEDLAFSRAEEKAVDSPPPLLLPLVKATRISPDSLRTAAILFQPPSPPSSYPFPLLSRRPRRTFREIMAPFRIHWGTSQIAKEKQELNGSTEGGKSANIHRRDRPIKSRRAGNWIRDTHYGITDTFILHSSTQTFFGSLCTGGNKFQVERT